MNPERIVADRIERIAGSPDSNPVFLIHFKIPLIHNFLCFQTEKDCGAFRNIPLRVKEVSLCGREIPGMGRQKQQQAA